MCLFCGLFKNHDFLLILVPIFLQINEKSCIFFDSSEKRPVLFAVLIIQAHFNSFWKIKAVSVSLETWSIKNRKRNVWEQNTHRKTCWNGGHCQVKHKKKKKRENTYTLLFDIFYYFPSSIKFWISKMFECFPEGIWQHKNWCFFAKIGVFLWSTSGGNLQIVKINTISIIFWVDFDLYKIHEMYIHKTQRVRAFCFSNPRMFLNP